MKLKHLTLIIASFLNLALVQGDLETKKLLDNQLTMLIPSDYVHVSKEEYVPEYQGAPAPDEYYGSSDKSFEITIMKMPERTENLDWCKAFSQSAFLARASATHYNNAITVNEIPMHLTEFEGVLMEKQRIRKCSS
ncbi:hypothetical protein N7U66_10030 [Lacinutrix neustonica]|uniref:Uncharacterized protein n=1 Tax=Lacinutrix neustonica TaxID=2980107 RepID=A0A9E8MY69_9FLAO|nr:hypothetical protein [Lacinutrix neustonica]WAC03728.1 hypothetical protein N7U66_10030 [Lacinutrix neustonica]